MRTGLSLGTLVFAARALVTVQRISGEISTPELLALAALTGGETVIPVGSIAAAPSDRSSLLRGSDAFRYTLPDRIGDSVRVVPPAGSDRPILTLTRKYD